MGSFTQHTTIPNAISYTIRDPLGVAVLISPWNLPLYLLTWKIAPCIAFGCTCVCKPSEFTSLTASMLAQVFLDAGITSSNLFYLNLFDNDCILLTMVNDQFLSQCRTTGWCCKFCFWDWSTSWPSTHYSSWCEYYFVYW